MAERGIAFSHRPSILISDSIGQPLFYTNGNFIMHENKTIFQNGTNLIEGFDNEVLDPRLVLVLPNSNQYGSYLIIHYDKLIPGLDKKKDLVVTRIDGVFNDSTGYVVYKRKIILEQKHTLYLAATKHANGKDWWLTTIEGKDSLHTNFDQLFFLVQGDFIELKKRIPFGNYTFGNANFYAEPVFSPDGKHLCYTDRHDGFFVWDFDRCTGELSNFRYDLYDRRLSVYFGSVSVSSNSRYAYITSHDFLLQYDLWANDLSTSKDTVAINDGYRSEHYYPGGPIIIGDGNYFDYCSLGPDRRIYVFRYGAYWQNYIAYPNRKGKACQVRQHAYYAPAGNSASFPYYPNYRLGPIDNSSCDTAGLDNHPLADFYWDFTQEVTGDPLWVEFTDNSFYEPATWSWDFGDGTASGDTSPVHIFPAAGTYLVCMTVCNANSCDTICKEVTVGVPITDLMADFHYLNYDTFTAHFYGENYTFPVTWSWDFGDGTLGDGQIPSHTYDSPGIYTVCLTVCNNTVCDTFCDEVTVGGSLATIKALFITTGSDTTSVRFKDLSFHNAATWTWDFGDGTTSTEKDPVHTFPAPGIYTVCLTTCNSFGVCDTYCKQITVDAANIVFYANFGFVITNSNEVTFQDQSQTNPISWSWNFGDGATSTEQHPTHIYTQAGTYTACLVACNALGICDTYCLDVVVETVDLDENTSKVEENLYTIFPNPVQNEVYIYPKHKQNTSNVIFSLYDITGRAVFTEKLSKNQAFWKINLGSLVEGLYFYAIKDVGGVVLQTGKVVKQR